MSHGAAAEEEEGGLGGVRCEGGEGLPLDLEVLTEDEDGRDVVAEGRKRRREGRERVVRRGSSENLAVVSAIVWGLSCISFNCGFQPHLLYRL